MCVHIQKSKSVFVNKLHQNIVSPKYINVRIVNIIIFNSLYIGCFKYASSYSVSPVYYIVLLDTLNIMYAYPYNFSPGLSWTLKYK